MASQQRCVNVNAFPITTPPPWSKSELNKKHVGALKQMLTAYNILCGHNWYKKDVVKALYEFSETWVQQEEKEEEISNQNVNQHDDIDECMFCIPFILAPITFCVH